MLGTWPKLKIMEKILKSLKAKENQTYVF